MHSPSYLGCLNPLKWCHCATCVYLLHPSYLGHLNPPANGATSASLLHLLLHIEQTIPMICHIPVDHKSGIILLNVQQSIPFHPIGLYIYIHFTSLGSSLPVLM